jgi:hypothetical protein
MRATGASCRLGWWRTVRLGVVSLALAAVSTGSSVSRVERSDIAELAGDATKERP